MTKELNNSAKRYEKLHKRRRVWHRIISVLSAFTVFVTTYALILPAITKEPSAGIKMDNTIVYENDDVRIDFYVYGRAAFENEKKAVKDAVGENVKLDVTFFDTDSAVYSEYAKYTAKSLGDDELYKLLAMELLFTYNGAKLNMDNCDISCEIVAKENIVEDSVKTMNANHKTNPVMGTLAHTTGGTTQAENTDKENDVLALTVIQGVSGAMEDRETAYLEAGGSTMRLGTTLANNTMALALYSTTNPSYTVQYYSHVTVFNTTGDANIAILDNSNANLAQNGVTYTVGNGLVDAHLDKVTGTDKYELATHQELAPMYTAKTYEYVKAPGIAYIDRNRLSANFKLNQVWVLKEGKSATSVNQADWTVYGANVSFTNRAESASSTRIHITDSTVMRLIYNEVSGLYSNNVQFYDYDITDGDIHDASGKAYPTTQQTSGTWYAATYNEGINSFTAAANTVKLAFGNTNSGTAHGSVTWNGNTINRYNNQSYKGCTFGIVTGKNADGTLKYASGISAPVLFTGAQQVGKTTINGYNLEFNRIGDTYTLSSVRTNTGVIAVNNLNYFNNPVCGTTTYTNIFTNNFWPMDASPTWGGIGHDLKFGDHTLKANRKFFQNDSTFSTTQGNFTISDDGLDHNSYFGMKYEVKFTLSEDYIGALEYMFYGDDDMWVFLDDTLICDIGGVHSSVGQFVDLWPYINKLSAANKYKEHTLSFYYTERGASGSTCYMAFTLPSVSSEVPQMETANLEIGKQVINGNTTQKFDFTVTLTEANGSAFTDDFSYTLYDANKNELGTYIINSAENTVSLSHGQYIIINYLPKGTKYTVNEAKSPGYHTAYTVNGGTSNDGSTATGTLTEDLKILFINSSGLLLPETGGTGILPYLIPFGLGVAMLVVTPIADSLIKHKKTKKHTA